MLKSDQHEADKENGYFHRGQEKGRYSLKQECNLGSGGITGWLEGPTKALSACGPGKRRTKERQIFYQAKEVPPKICSKIMDASSILVQSRL